MAQNYFVYNCIQSNYVVPMSAEVAGPNAANSEIDWEAIRLSGRSEVSERAGHGERLHDILRHAVMTGLLAPGDRLRETQMAKALHVSRTPLREALQRLRNAGLVTQSPHGGWHVVKLSHAEIVDLYQMRAVIEAAGAGFAANRASYAERERLKGMLVEEATLQARGDPDAMARHNRAFHAAIHQAAHNPFLLNAVEGMRAALVLVGPTTFILPERMQSVTQEHRAIAEAIIRNDADSAEKAARQHIRNAEAARLAWRAQQATDQPEWD